MAASEEVLRRTTRKVLRRSSRRSCGEPRGGPRGGLEQVAWWSTMIYDEKDRDLVGRTNDSDRSWILGNDDD